jgi:putative ABC transport system permease protein
VSLWRQVTRGLRALIHPSAADQDVADEVQHYLDQTVAEQVARGSSPEEARRHARRELRSAAGVREQVRSSGWESAVEAFLADLRGAGRRLRAEPGFTAVATLTMALGLGAVTAIVSAVHPILVEPLPYPDARRITMIWELGQDGAPSDGTFGMYRELAVRAESLEHLAVLGPWRPTMTGPQEPERFEGQRVSAGYFPVLGVSPVMGRSFEASEDGLNGPNVVVLSDRLWRRRFGGDPAIVGRQITLDDAGYTVIGVMPSGFENVLAPTADVWAPLQYDMSQGRAWGHHLRTVARLRRGIGIERVTQELRALGEAVLREQRPATYGARIDFVVTRLQDDVTRGVKPALLAILGAVTLVLVIACVNVTNLLLARDARRRGEFALRAALGAGQGRLVRQVLTEGLLLSAIGGAAGIALAVFAVRVLVALSPAGLPRAGAIAVDQGVFAFALVITTLVGLVCGVIPALHAARSEPHATLQQDSPRTAAGPRRTRSGLVITEVALAVILLVSSGLLLRSLQRLFAVEAGFDPSQVLTMQVQTSGRRFAADSTTYRFFEEALAAVRRVPGVTAAALTSQLPLSGDFDSYGVHFDPSPSDDPGEVRGTFRYAVSPGYFGALGIPLRRGRVLEESDRAEAPRVAVVSEALARRRLPGRDPIGIRLRIGTGPLYTVVGVVADVRQLSLAVNDAEAVYVTAAQWRFADNTMSLVVRTRDEPATLVAPLRQAVWSVDKDQPIVRVATMEDLVAASAAERRFVLTVFESFALAALLLAAAGLYGLLSGGVAERTREIGVRLALGASRGSILALVMRQGMTLTGLGVVIGVAGAVAASQVIAALLFDVSRLDPMAYAGVIAMLAAVALIASGVPAWRAARIDAARALRAE